MAERGYFGRGGVAVTHVISCWPFQGLGADSEVIGPIHCVNDMCKTETLNDSNVQMMERLWWVVRRCDGSR